MAGVSTARRGKARGPVSEGHEDAAASANDAEQALLEDLRRALRAVREGDFSARLSTRRRGLLGEIAASSTSWRRPTSGWPRSSCASGGSSAARGA